jgi:hypothetical protein
MDKTIISIAENSAGLFMRESNRVGADGCVNR